MNLCAEQRKGDDDDDAERGKRKKKERREEEKENKVKYTDATAEQLGGLKEAKRL